MFLRMTFRKEESNIVGKILNFLRPRLCFKCLAVTFLFGFVLFIGLKFLLVRTDYECSRNKTSLHFGELQLINLSAANIEPRRGKSIFFHETTCSANDFIHFTGRQGCSVESAALANPATDVFVLFTTSKYLPSSVEARIIDTLTAYPNIHLHSVDLFSYAYGTPIYSWLQNGDLFSSKYVKSHLSDFLRYLTLFKWGGTYLDLDVVVRRSLEQLQPNYAGAESNTHVAAGVMNLDYKSVGHDLAATMLRHFQQSFDGNSWGNNGPGVITRVLQKLCKTKSPQIMTRERCFGFKVAPVKDFYAVPWPRWKDFFDPTKIEYIFQEIKNSTAVHVWNFHSQQQFIRNNSRTAYLELAASHCPRMFHSNELYSS